MIPTEIRAGIDAYLKNGLRPGGFTRAVLANDLISAARRAHPTINLYLADIALWVEDNVPACARGSYQTVDEWVDGHVISPIARIHST